MFSLTDDRIDAAVDAETLVRLLIDSGKELPPRLRERILESGPTVIPFLLALLDDRRLSLDTVLGESHAQLHAVQLLVDLQSHEATEPLLRLLTCASRDSEIYEAIFWSLPDLGPALMEPTLAAYGAATGKQLRSDLRIILSDLGARDERIFRILVETLEEDPLIGPSNLASYGDPRALPFLFSALDQYEEGYELIPNEDLLSLRDAILELGGVLSPEQRERIDYILNRDARARQAAMAVMARALLKLRRERDREPHAPSPAPALKMNNVRADAPCPCGSGRRYGDCCRRRK